MSYRLLLFSIIFHQVCALEDPLNFYIVGGVDAEFNSIPWQASLRYKREDRAFGAAHFCGGTLISEKTILTASHCFMNQYGEITVYASNIRIVGGNVDRFWFNDSTYIGSARNFVLHPRYSNVNYGHDIAIINLRKPANQFYPFFRTIPLNTQEIPPDTVCSVSGWGRMRHGGKLSRTLRVVNVTVFPNKKCKKAYNGIPAKIICAGDDDGYKDSCQGDSGGPLVCNGRLAGIVSYGEDCGNPEFPGVYTDISKYLDWIEKNEGVSIRLRKYLNCYWLILLIVLGVW